MKVKDEVATAEITYDEEKKCVSVRLSDDGKNSAKQEETKPFEDLTYDDIKDEIGITICDRKRDPAIFQGIRLNRKRMSCRDIRR